MSDLRYVVLHHTEIEKPHYDLLFQWPDRPSLGSVRCSDWPPNAATTFQRIADHRAIYLDCEGSLTQDRGAIQRVESGACTLANTDHTGLVLTLSSGLRIRVPAIPGK
jgi:hypothetical protein